MRRFVFVFLVAYLILNVLGNAEELNLTYHQLSVKDGLSQDTVTAVLHDRQGFIWLGTNDGLNRYDGTSFKQYKSDANDPATPGGNYILSLLQDSQGMIWIGTRAGGLTRFDPVKEEFTRFRHNSLQTGSLGNNHVRCLALCSWGGIWVGTADGLDRFDPPTGLFEHYRHIPGEAGSISHNNIRSLALDISGTLWVGTWGGGLNILKGKNSEFSCMTALPGQENPLPDNRVSALSLDDHDGLYIGTPNGFCHLNLLTGVVTRYHGDDLSGKLDDNEINSLYYDTSGYLWIGTHMGLHFFNSYNRKISGYLSVANMPYKLGKNLVNCIYKDQSGNIWTGIWGGGVYRANPSLNIFKNYRKDADRPNSFSDSDISAIYGDRQGIYWIGTMNGLNRFDRENYRITRYLHQPDNKGSLSENEISGILEDRSGVLWIGTKGGGLNQLDRRGRSFIHFREKTGLSSDYVTCLEEGPGGQLWIGTNGAGLSILDQERKNFQHYKHDPADPRSISDNHISCIYRDRGGVIWVGTEQGGLNRFISSSRNFDRFTPNPRDPESIGHNHVNCITQHSNGSIWVGTAGGGLHSMEVPGGGFRRFTQRNGLPSNVIQGILEDEQGILWVSTDKGLARFNPVTFETRHYDLILGLESNEFNTRSYYKSNDGELFFGGIDGFNAFYPSHVRDIESIPPVVITNFRINNRPVPIGKMGHDRKILHKSITQTEQINLYYKDNALSFRFAVLNYVHPERNRYSYMLEGFENDWHYVNRQNYALYINLPPGEYQFRVRGSLDGENWNEKGASVKIFILPPFWRTTLFRLLAILLGVGIFFFIHRLRVRNLERKRGRLELMVEQRTRELETANQYKSQFLARMSHEIRTPMNSVIGFTDMLLDTNLDDEQLSYARTIHHSGEMLLVLINDILDLSRIEAGQLAFEPVDFDPEVVVFHVVESMTPRLGNKPVEILCRIGDRVPAFVRTDAGRFRQVLINLTGNAVKFTEQGVVELSLDVEREEVNRIKLHTIVRDTGIGIPKDQLELIFDVFQQGDGSITRKYGGTGLGLAICKQIARLMGGDVWAESKRGQGSEFHFTAWLEKSTKITAHRVFPPHLTGKRILLVDDNSNNLEILSHQLTRVGMRIKCLDNGKQVVPTLIESFRDKDPFELCILDIKLPGMSGYQILEDIRNQDSYIANLPVLALSSSTTCRSKKFQDAGFDGFLPRPIHRQKLIDMAVRLLGEREVNGKKKAIESFLTRHTLDEEAKHSIRILLAEDNPVNQKLTHFMLTKAGYQLDVVNNGQEAVAAVLADPGGYDMILMDVQMPVMDGREATRIIREKGFTHIPIVAITADVMKGDREKLLEAGMDDYISKPIKRAVVFEKLKKWAIDRKN